MDNSSRSILLIEDNQGDVLLIKTLLKEGSKHTVTTEKKVEYKIENVKRLREGIEILKNFTFSLILLDLALPDSHGISSFEEIYRTSPETPIVILTSLDDEEIAMKTLSLGAQDYLFKQELHCKILLRSLNYAIERQKLLIELKKAKDEIKALTELIPICASCKNIKNDKGYWQQVEEYISQRSDAEFSHSLCPVCLKKLYPDFADSILEKLEGQK